MAYALITAFITYKAREYIRAGNSGTKNVDQVEKMKLPSRGRAVPMPSLAHMSLPDSDALKLSGRIPRYCNLPHDPRDVRLS